MSGPVWAVVLAGGGGRRFGGPKQHADLGGRTLLQRTVATASGCCDGVVVVLPEPPTDEVLDDLRPAGQAVELRVATGGAVRAESVRAGLAAVPVTSGTIVVADAAHPLASPELYRRVIDAVRAGADAAAPGLPLTEAVATVEPWTAGSGPAAPPGVIGTTGYTVAAGGRVLVQTPQAFRAAVLRAAHRTGADAVEDASLVAAWGATVVVVPGDPLNVHVTTSEELAVARLLLPAAETHLPRQVPGTGRARAMDSECAHDAGVTRSLPGRRDHQGCGEHPRRERRDGR